jgi:hypothetical protein
MIFVLPLGLVACGSKSATKPSPEPAPEPKKSEIERKVETGTGEMTQQGEDQKPSFTVRWKRSTLAIQESAGEGKFQEVTGDLLDANGVASKFTADAAVAKKNPAILAMTGRPEIKSLRNDAVIRADTIRWLDSYGLIEANGNVSIDSPEYSLRGVPALLASRDMSKVGTPDVFKKQIEATMKAAKLKNLALPLLLAATSRMPAQAQSKVADMVLENFDSLSREIKGEQMLFKVTGKPTFEGFWAKKGMRVVAREAEGFALPAPEGGYDLKEATFSGDLLTTIRNDLAGGSSRILQMSGTSMKYTATASAGSAEVRGPVTLTQKLLSPSGSTTRQVTLTGSSATADFVPFGQRAKAPLRGAVLSGPVTGRMMSEGSSGERTTTFSGSRVELVEGAERSTMNLGGSITVTSSVSGPSGQKVTFTGKRGSVEMAPLQESSTQPLRSLNLSGGTTVVLTEVQTGKDGKKNPIRVNAKGDDLTYTVGAEGTAVIVLSGNVEFDGEDSQLLGNTKCQAATIYLNSKGEVAKVVFKGAGRSEIKEKIIENKG